jgi:L-fucose isomerase-like protein
MTKKTTFGLIVGNRGFFPGHLCETGRKTMTEVLEQEGSDVIVLGPDDTKYGSVESLSDATRCADLFKRHADEIDGLVVTLPNFGDERAVANTIRFSGLDVPVLVHAFPDDMTKMTQANRRDSFCGKLSVCNNLKQYGIPFTLTSQHTMDPQSEDFRQDVRQFAATCRVVKGMRKARVGALGARPTAFNTVRYSEKILEYEGIAVETLDLSDAFGRAGHIKDNDPKVPAKLAEIKEYADTHLVPAPALTKMAKFGAVLDSWISANQLNAVAIQCWTAMEEFFGITPCTVMSILSNKLLPNACETDVNGALSMYALALASGKPSALLDWNNNYADDPDKAIVFHCSNLPADFFEKKLTVDYHKIIADSVGKDLAYGVVEGRIKPVPFTYLRISTDDLSGTMMAYAGEGEFTTDPVTTFGGYGVVNVPDFQELLRYMCDNGFEHHVAANQSTVAASIEEALGNYLGWDIYLHE